MTLAFVPVLLFAQSTGKIAGVVTDSETGEALVGVNVYLDGTSLGSASDEDGYFVILGVPTGGYTIVAEYVGYNKMTIEGLRVSAAVTTTQDFAMTSTALQLEDVVIYAQRDLIQKNVTSSLSILEAGEIQQLPVRGLTNLIALQPSVVVQNGNVHIRGSRDDEVGYYLDGADIANPVTRTRATTIINEAVEELAVEAGAFDAEFGGANGGIVRTELRSGASKFEGSLDWRVDGFGDAGDSFLGATSYGWTNTVLTLGGPLFTDNIRFFVANEMSFQRDANPLHYEAFAYNGLEAPTYGLESNAALLDTVNVVWDGTYRAKNSFDRNSTNATVIFDYNPLKIKLGGTYTLSTDERNTTPILQLLNPRGNAWDRQNLLLNAKLTYVVNPKMFIDARVTYFYDSFESMDSWFGNEYQKWYDPELNDAKGANFYNSGSGTARPVDYNLYSFRFEKPGNPYTGTYSKGVQEYYGFAANFTSQIGKIHEVKAGFDYKAYTVRRYAVGVANWDQLQDEFYAGLGLTGQEKDDQFALLNGVNHYGYDVYGQKENDSGIDAAKQPQFASVYLQDKLEYNDLVLKLGLRFDYFDSDDKRFIDAENPDISGGVIQPEAYEEVDPFYEVSPRIAMSFPASETMVFYTGYGRFIQMTQLQNIYSGNYANSLRLQGGFAYLNPYGRDLKPTETVNYEVGMRKSLGDIASIDVSAFYRNIKGQIQPTRILTDPGSQAAAYNALVNGTFATNKGIELKFTLRRTNRIQTSINYTYTNAQGTGSATNSAVASLEQNTNQPTIISPLDWNQTHRGNFLVDYRFAKGDGGPVFEQFGINVIYAFNSGRRFTLSSGEYGQSTAALSAVDFETDPRSRRPLEPINNSEAPWSHLWTLRLDKSFDIYKSFSAMLYLEVLNLFDTKNTLNVYSRTGSSEDDGFINNFNSSKLESAINNFGPEFVDFYKDVNIKNGESWRQILGTELWDTPRQVRLGLKLQF
jgi:outer membrane receptor protein involved in Fe transport